MKEEEILAKQIETMEKAQKVHEDIMENLDKYQEVKMKIEEEMNKPIQNIATILSYQKKIDDINNVRRNLVLKLDYLEDLSAELEMKFTAMNLKK